jgi:hypothetical protein
VTTVAADRPFDAPASGRPRCAAVLRDGARCRGLALVGVDLCALHEYGFVVSTLVRAHDRWCLTPKGRAALEAGR